MDTDRERSFRAMSLRWEQVRRQDELARRRRQQDLSDRWRAPQGLVFDRLLERWLELVEHEEQSTQTRWNRQLQRMSEQQARERLSGCWFDGPRDVLSILDCSRSEAVHRRFLGWLLDPLAPHRLGARFLQRILGRVGPEQHYPYPLLLGARVRCAEQHRQIRADIVVRAPELCLVLLLKIDGREEHALCDLVHEAYAGEGGARFVFVTPGGRYPHSAGGQGREAFFPLALGEIAAMLEDLFQDQERSGARGPGTIAARAYLASLKKEFA